MINSNKSILLSVKNLTVKKGDILTIQNLNFDIFSNETLLIYSDKELISELCNIFTFDIFHGQAIDGKVIYKNNDIISFIKNIKKFEINGKNIAVLSGIMSDIFAIPANPCDLFNNSENAGDQILDFLHYKTRINLINSIIRREMIKIEDINNIIKIFDSSHNKYESAISIATDFGITDIVDHLFEVLNNKNNRINNLSALLIHEKKGINLAEMVNLRDYYKVRRKYNELKIEQFNYIINNGKKNRKLKQEIRNIERKEKHDFGGFDLTILKVYSEKILVSEIKNIIISILKLFKIDLVNSVYEEKCMNIETTEIYKILVAIAVLNGSNLVIIDTGKSSGMIEEMGMKIKNMFINYNIGTVYLGSNQDVAKNDKRLFDRVILDI